MDQYETSMCVCVCDEHLLNKEQRPGTLLCSCETKSWIGWDSGKYKVKEKRYKTKRLKEDERE